MFSGHTTSSMVNELWSPTCSSHTGPVWCTPPILSAVPPPTLRVCSGISFRYRMLRVGSIQPVRPFAAARSPLLWPRRTSAHPSPRLAHPLDASCAIRVPRAGSLPAASFRFRFATDTLAVRLGVPAIKASTGAFTRPVATPARFRYPVASVRHDATGHA